MTAERYVVQEVLAEGYRGPSAVILDTERGNKVVQTFSGYTDNVAQARREAKRLNREGR